MTSASGKSSGAGRRGALARQHGASMIELMVALVIGMIISMAAISGAQMFGTVGRSQGGQGSALGSAAAAIGAIKFDAQMAGLGFFSDATALCPTVNLAVNNAVVAQNRVFQAARIDLLADGTDQIELVYGTSISSGMGARTLSPMASAMGQVIVDTGAGLVANQAVLLSYPAMALPCTVATVSSAVAGVGGRTTVQFNAAARFTPASWTTSLPNAPAYPDASSVSSLGDLVWRRYFVRNDTLIMLDVLTNTEVMIAEGVVRVRAQYGLAADATSTTVTTWQNAVGNAPLSAADQQRLRAIRLGVVSVNTQRERPASAGSCDTTLAAPVLWPGEAVDLSARTDWQCFRYRSYSTVVGLRNLQWGQSL